MKKQIKEFYKERVTSETPDYWKKIRMIGLIIVGVGTALMTAPVSLPAVLVSAGSYMVWIGGVAAGLATTAKK
ncbi:MAG: hypothetical protein WC389_22630 [Lutibacter sp.]|jgi:hypothetical protein